MALVRGPAGRKNNPGDGELAQYVNDRPYAASSMLAVALKEAFRTALTGRCDARPELAESRIPLAIRVPALSRRRGAGHEAILAILRELGARRVGDFGCGSGVLTRVLLAERHIEKVVAVDVSARALQLAARDLRLDRMPDRERERLEIFQSALTCRDDRLAGLDAAVLMEVIEHIDAERLPALKRSVFGFAAPAAVVITTPNAEYNPHFAGLQAGAMRHRDHRFEWTRAEFRSWAQQTAGTHGYQVSFRPVGPEHPDAGSPTQLALFTKAEP